MVSLSCNKQHNDYNHNVSARDSLQSYWYNNEAEISSYQLKQYRYGESRIGKAVLVYVTEPFSEKTNTKADLPNKNNIPVLKLNATKNFLTGIYPYHIMTSTFFPFNKGKHSLKMSFSAQEWCGHVYMELKNDKKEFKLQTHSYFEGESTKEVNIPKAILEDDLWSMIRLYPDKLPTGRLQVIPSATYIRLSHKEFKPYECVLNIQKKNHSITSYTINYPTLNRTLLIRFESEFPYKILHWKESITTPNKNGVHVTSGTILKTIKTDYWNKNSVSDESLRKELELD